MTVRGPRPAVWVVVAAYNEAGRLGKVLADLTAFWKDVVVVDDGSTDDTPAEASRYPVWLVRHATNLGQGAALQTGLAFALSKGAQAVVTFDADGQHDHGDIERLVNALAETGADFALGSRFLGGAVGMPFSRHVVLRAAVLFSRVFHRMKVTDAHNGLRAMTRRGASSLAITLNRMEHASQILDQIRSSGLPWVEVPVTIRYTQDTLAKGQRSSAAIRLALRLLLERWLG